MAVRGLRGIAFERAAAPEDRVLPRMDVVGFVGLAASGPVDLPVPIENTGQFVAIFGDDLRVSTGLGGVRRAFLGAAVRAFFANGGERCWVVRVVGPGASAARFVLPGVCASPFSAEPGAALELVARSPGSWAEGLAVTTAPRTRPVRLRGVHLRPHEDSLHARLQADLHPDDPLVPGELLVLRIGGARLLAAVESIDTRAARPLRTGPLVWGATAGSAPVPALLDDMLTQTLPPGLNVTAEVWSFDLHVRVGQRQLHSVRDLTFHPLHPRHWRRLPDDVALFSSSEIATSSLGRDVSEPRLPVAGRASAGWELPVAATEPILDWELPDHSFSAAAWEDARSEGTAWQRDGATTFDPAILLDPDLQDEGLESLLAQADDLRYLRPHPRRLRGVHALLGTDEVTLISLPDLVQPPWLIDGSVAAVIRTLEPASAGFQGCGPGGLAAPVWDPPQADAAAATIVGWDAGGPARTYVLERAESADFRGAEPVLRGQGRSVQLDLRQPQLLWLRVRAETDDRVGPWSRALKLEVPPGATLRDRAPTDAMDPAVAQRVVLRMCAARGDLVALLAAPDEGQCAPIEHLRRLRTWDDASPGIIAPLAGAERRALSHAGLWAPWLLVREADGELRALPPDGAIAGLVARHARERGAWVAPANLPIRDVVAASRPLDDAQAQAWLLAGIQAIRREPWGLVGLGADTLADPDSEVQLLHVRRLLALLRRLVLRHGQDWVFAPQSPAFVRGVEVSFEVVMRHLYSLGAFAGDRPSSAYSVRVQQNPGEAERGRFIVELRVAPALPLRFLTVRLVQSDAQGLTAEGV